MGAFKWIYGGLAIFFALDAMLFGILPGQVLQIGTVILGILILFTPMGGVRTKPTFAQQIRRFFFGAFIVIIGLIPFIQNYSGSFVYGTLIGRSVEWLHWASIEIFSGQIILLLIGVIYFFAGTKRGDKAIYSQ